MDSLSPMPPHTFSFRVWYRKSSAAVIAFGVIAAVFGVFTRLPQEQTIGATLRNPAQVITFAGLFVLYVLYLFLVVNHAFLQRSISEVRGLHCFMPYALLAAYWTIPIEFWVYGQPTVLASSMFIVVYLAWLIDSLLSMRQKNDTETQATVRPDNIVWCVLDVVSLLALVVDGHHVLAGGASHGQTVASGSAEPWAIGGVHLHGKDVAIVVSVIGCFVQMAILRATRREFFPEAASYYVNAIERVEGADVGVQSAATWLKERFAQKERMRVFDFGSGNSLRTQELLRMLNVDPGRVHIDRFDKLPEWKVHGPTGTEPGEFRAATFTSHINKAMEAIAQCDIVIASHSLYEPKAVADLQRLLRAVKPGVVVIARGGSPHSFLAPIVFYRLFSWQRPFFAACWDSDGLAFICQKNRLVSAKLPGLSAGRPVVIGQSLKVSSEGIGYIEKALRYTYGLRVAASVRRMLTLAIGQAHVHAGKKTVMLPVHDLLYIYEQLPDRTHRNAAQRELDAVPVKDGQMTGEKAIQTAKR